MGNGSLFYQRGTGLDFQGAKERDGKSCSLHRSCRSSGSLACPPRLGVFPHALFHPVDNPSPLHPQSSYILPGLNFGSSAAQIPFLLSLLALEGSIVSYWLGIIDVWAFMPAVGVVSISALLGGISALGQKTKERLGM